MDDNERMKAISSDLQNQWQDHFDMRNQTWKLLQYSIIFFIGVVGLKFKENIDKSILIWAYVAVILTSAIGVIIAIHHRRRQKEKFEIIEIYAKELGIFHLIESILNKSKKGWTGKISTSIYIIVMQLSLCSLSIFMLIKLILTN